MNLVRSDRGFLSITHPSYVEQQPEKLVSQSSAIGPYEDSWERPGTSFLWIGDKHHLNREEVAELVSRLFAWLAKGTLERYEGECPRVKRVAE